MTPSLLPSSLTRNPISIFIITAKSCYDILCLWSPNYQNPGALLLSPRMVVSDIILLTQINQMKYMAQYISINNILITLKKISVLSASLSPHSFYFLPPLAP